MKVQEWRKRFAYRNDITTQITHLTNGSSSNEEWWRIVDLKLDDKIQMIDWSHEREWRIKGHLKFRYSQVEIIVPNPKYRKKLIQYCEDNRKQKMLKEIKSIITLNSIYC